MQFTATEISRIVNGKIQGNADVIVNSFGKIEDAQQSQLTFLSNPKYEDYLYTSNASIIILNDKHQVKKPLNATLIFVEDAHAAFVTLLTKYKEMTTQQMNGLQQPCYISASAKTGSNIFLGVFSSLGENVSVGNNTKIFPNCYIGNNVQIGDDCILYAGVKIYSECIVKNNVIIHSGAVIGSDGFGFMPQPDGTVKKVPQIGNVIIEDNVEIGANTTIDRSTIGSTIIKSGTKLDNLVQIAHNVEVGSNTVIAAQAGISGSTKIGNNVMIGGQAGLTDHVQIADGVKIAAQSGVSKSILKPGTVVIGSPAKDYMTTLRIHALLPKLPQIEKRLIALEENSGKS
jgi:UDP-3-O-[3-hydroxymyristoyl] glucosamine N-acyltransferase